MSQKHDQILPLTGLRAIAALWVVLVHVEIAHPPNAPYWGDLLLGSFGTLPVVFFFALSGFVLTVVYLPRMGEPRFTKEDTRKYTWARFARIIPLYVASIIPALTVLFIRLAGERTGFTQLYRGFYRKFLEMDGSVLDYLLRANIPAWTLLAEVLFYALFPWMVRRLLVTKDKDIPKSLAWTLGSFFVMQATLMGMYFWGSETVSQYANGVSHFGAPVFVPIFLAGMLLGLVYHRGLVPKWVHSNGGRIYITMVLVILGSAFYRQPQLPVSFISAVLAPVFCLTILAATSKTGKTNAFLSSRPMQLLGLASYSIYITHWPMRDMLTPVLMKTPLAQYPIVAGWVLIGLLVLIGYYAHLVIELPMHRWIMSKYKHKSGVLEQQASL